MMLAPLGPRQQFLFPWRSSGRRSREVGSTPDRCPAPQAERDKFEDASLWRSWSQYGLAAAYPLRFSASTARAQEALDNPSVRCRSDWRLRR